MTLWAVATSQAVATSYAISQAAASLEVVATSAGQQVVEETARRAEEAVAVEKDGVLHRRSCTGWAGKQLL